MPGINVTTAVRTGPVGTTDIVSGQAFMIGATERGPVDEPLLLRSFQDYITYYGNYQADSLYMHAKTFFDEGGSRLWVRRAHSGAASAAIAGTATIRDSAASASMLISAKTPGPWSSNLSVEVQDSTTAGSTVASAAYRILIRLDNELVLTTRDLVDITDGVNVINSSGISHLVEASGPVVPNAGLPVAASAEDFQPGAAADPTVASIASDLLGNDSDARTRYADGAFSANLKSG
ncbi:MAG: hypothetical protein VW620_11745, partial [Rhodospirillales bacterium]